MESPIYEHDCDNCEFLGHYKGADLYWCVYGVQETAIARFSSDDPDYHSGRHVTHPEQLGEANRRADAIARVRKESK